MLLVEPEPTLLAGGRETKELTTPTLDLIRHNTNFRLLWLAEAISLAGDWFTLIALAVVVSRATGGSGLAVGALVVTQLFPWVVVGPRGGVLADRFDRKRLLIATDLGRALNVLLLIPAASGGRLSLVLLLVFVHFSLSSIFEPARFALVPRLVAPHQLVTAATLSSVTWSVMLAAGGEMRAISAAEARNVPASIRNATGRDWAGRSPTRRRARPSWPRPSTASP